MCIFSSQSCTKHLKGELFTYIKIIERYLCLLNIGKTFSIIVLEDTNNNNCNTLKCNVSINLCIVTLKNKRHEDKIYCMSLCVSLNI